MKKSYYGVMNAMIACIYAVLTIICSSISYGGIQFRISEIMILLAFYNKKFIPGLVAGCFIANIPSTLGVADMFFGTLATLIAVLMINKVKSLYTAAFIGGIVNGLIVGYELYLVLKLPFVINALSVFFGEFVVLMLGVLVFKRIEKNEKFINQYIKD